MKNKCIFLACLLLISGTAVGLMGIVVKYAVLEPLGVYREEPAVALPFILLREDGLQYVITTLQNQQTQTAPTAPESTAPTQTQLEETTADDINYLDSPLFIGDFRTCGLRDHARLTGADYFCDVGMNVFNASQVRLSDDGFADLSLQELLEKKSYSCVILGLGLNESGYPIESIDQAYAALLEKIRAAQPDAVIVLQGILTVGKAWERKAPYTAPHNLKKINACIQKMADENQLIFCDPNKEFADGDGYLPEAASEDGCHLNKEYSCRLSDWLCNEIQTRNT